MCVDLLFTGWQDEVELWQLVATAACSSVKQSAIAGRLGRARGCMPVGTSLVLKSFVLHPVPNHLEYQTRFPPC